MIRNCHFNRCGSQNFNIFLNVLFFFICTLSMPSCKLFHCHTFSNSLLKNGFSRMSVIWTDKKLNNLFFLSHVLWQGCVKARQWPGLNTSLSVICVAAWGGQTRSLDVDCKWIISAVLYLIERKRAIYPIFSYFLPTSKYIYIKLCGIHIFFPITSYTIACNISRHF